MAANSNNNNNNTITNKIVPIFSGKHWIKLTFDNPNSALQALQENGNVFNGSIIGVVPYHKSIIEKLENRKIFINDNDSTIMGEGNLDIPLDKVNQIINQQSKLVSTPGGTLNKTTTTLLARLFLQVQLLQQQLLQLVEDHYIID